MNQFCVKMADSETGLSDLMNDFDLEDVNDTSTGQNKTLTHAV